MPFLFLNIGPGEMVIIGLVALLMFGGRLPEVARSLGKSVNQFKKGLKEVEDDLDTPDPPAPPKSLPSRAEAAKSETAKSETEKTPQP